jgi:hypothetical protein
MADKEKIKANIKKRIEQRIAANKAKRRKKLEGNVQQKKKGCSGCKKNRRV